MPTSVDAKIYAHHVGARGFAAPFGCPPRFDADIVQILYEADADCAEQMRKSDNKTNRYVLPYCIGGENRRGTLNVTVNPYGSSVYVPNKEYASYYGEVYPGDDVYDAIFGEWCRTEKVVDVDIVSLDSLFDDGLVPVAAPPDILSLDTQGSESDIIRGAKKTIRRGVLALATEIEFHPIYSEQPLIDDILRQARELGFHFAGFLHTSDEISPYRSPVGLRGRSFLAFGDALFLRKVETLKDLAENDEHHYVMSLKLAFIAIVFGFTEYGMGVLAHAETIMSEEEAPADIQSRVYFVFLMRLKKAARKMDQLYLNTRVDPEPSKPLKLEPDAYIDSKLVQWKRRTKSTISQEYRIFYRTVCNVADRGGRFVWWEPFRYPRRFVLRVVAKTLRYMDRFIDPIPLWSPFHRSMTLIEQIFNEYELYWALAIIQTRRKRTMSVLRRKPHAYTVTPGQRDEP
ncbi:MAG: FkbM family methyltransferase [Alphaproteobacteria bacterium]